MKYPNTKQQPLINTSIIIKNKDIQKYLFNLHNSLNIQQWIIESNNGNDTKYKQIGKIVLNKICITLDKIISDLQLAHLSTTHQMISTMSYQGYHGSSLYQRRAVDTRYNPMIIVSNNNVNTYPIFVLLLT